MLPANVLLEIFKIYINEATETEEWHILVHVCPKWRSIVFSSPRHLRLCLQLLCTTRTPVRERLAIWPALPIAIVGSFAPTSLETSLVLVAGNIMVALSHGDRVCHIDLEHIPSHLLAFMTAALEEPLPALTDLALDSDQNAPVLPDTLLGGFAPRLRSLRLTRIPFPALPKLLLSATYLATLHLWDIPHSGYISPEVMVTCLFTLTMLRSLRLGFQSPLSHPGRTRERLPGPSLAPTVHPTLASLEFKGVCEYLEDIIARIEAPPLNDLRITFFNQLVFDTPQLSQFISHTKTFSILHQADLVFHSDFVEVRLTGQAGEASSRTLVLGISCTQSDWQLSSLTQVCVSFLAALECIHIREDRGSQPHWHDDVENSQWLELLHSFTTVKDLYLSSIIGPHIMSALGGLTGERVTEVLPSLQSIFLEPLPSQHLWKTVENFVSARQLSGLPVRVDNWYPYVGWGNATGWYDVTRWGDVPEGTVTGWPGDDGWIDAGGC